MRVYRYIRYTDHKSYSLIGRATDLGLQAWDSKQRIWVDGRGLFGPDYSTCLLEISLLGVQTDG